MSWLQIITVTWLLLAAVAALLIGSAIRAADETELDEQPVLGDPLFDRPYLDDSFQDEPNIVADLPVEEQSSDAPRPVNDPPTIPGIPSARPPVGRPSSPPQDGTGPRKSRPA